jgi:hypothetical protein
MITSIGRTILRCQNYTRRQKRIAKPTPSWFWCISIVSVAPGARNELPLTDCFGALMYDMLSSEVGLSA